MFAVKIGRRLPPPPDPRGRRRARRPDGSAGEQRRARAMHQGRHPRPDGRCDPGAPDLVTDHCQLIAVNSGFRLASCMGVEHVPQDIGCCPELVERDELHREVIAVDPPEAGREPQLVVEQLLERGCRCRGGHVTTPRVQADFRSRPRSPVLTGTHPRPTHGHQLSDRCPIPARGNADPTRRRTAGGRASCAGCGRPSGGNRITVRMGSDEDGHRPIDQPVGVPGDGSEPARFVVIDGRRWRATDPSIPSTFRAELVRELMDARRAIGGVSRAGGDTGPHRERVGDAKVALGERGEPWWATTADGRRKRIAATIRTLLRARSPGSSICPSDVARAIGGSSWRSLVPDVRAVAAELATAGVIVVTQGDRTLDATTARGPIRLRRGPGLARD